MLEEKMAVQLFCTTLPLAVPAKRTLHTSKSSICPKRLSNTRSAFCSRKSPTPFQVHAYIREWPYPEFIAEVKAAFPDKAIATVEEARVLFSEDGYAYLDVRPALELEEVGKVKDSVNIPLYNSVRKYNSETRQKEVVKTENEKFKEQIEKRFPDKGAKIIVACSDGRAYSMDALEALDEMGYTNLVGLKGGYYAWFRVFDNKLNRRRVQGEYSETYTHDGDSCGIHSSGAGFDKVDAIEAWVPPQY